jgi:hypothetical protein
MPIGPSHGKSLTPHVVGAICPFPENIINRSRNGRVSGRRAPQGKFGTTKSCSAVACASVAPPSEEFEKVVEALRDEHVHERALHVAPDIGQVICNVSHHAAKVGRRLLALELDEIELCRRGSRVYCDLKEPFRAGAIPYAHLIHAFSQFRRQRGRRVKHRSCR